jgi:hypothetical protein
VAFTPQGAIAYFGGNPISGLAVCNNTQVDSAVGSANLLAPTPDGTHLIGAGMGGWIDLSYTISNSNGCPPSVSKSVRNAVLPASVGTPTQIAVASDDSNAFLTGYTGGTNATAIPFYHLADGTAGAIKLVGLGGPLYSGGLTQDSHSLYVGIGANGSTGPQVHRIDLTASSGPADANQINVAFNPRIVVVKPK